MRRVDRTLLSTFSRLCFGPYCALALVPVLAGMLAIHLAYGQTSPSSASDYLPLDLPPGYPLQAQLHRLPATQKLPRVDVRVNGETFDLEVAMTAEDLHRGLMYRAELGRREGMVFPFQPPRRVDFWMKNCLIPLDMVFSRQGRIVHIVHSAAPCLQEPCPTYPSVHSVDMVLELPAGTAKELALQPGHPVEVQLKTQKTPTPLPEAVPQELQNTKVPGS